MIEVDGDVAVVGSGFGGSLLALIAQRLGLRAAIVERGTHPRFALGESATPIAGLVLEALATRYDLPALLPLARYGRWRRECPQVMRGLKRGFSYFHHRAGAPFGPRADHATELLVEANPDAERADTHWKRADVDAHLVRLAADHGATFLDETLVSAARLAGRWLLHGERRGEPVRVTAPLLVDASGPGGFLARTLGIPSAAAALRTRSRCVFSHFRGVRPWAEIYRALGGRIDDHPFPCDAAALHHVFDGGWMWILRFDDGVVSAGFSLEPDRFPPKDGAGADDEWETLLRAFPSIRAQFDGAKAVMPVRRTGRLQRLAARAAGRDWAMLPAAAGGVDALHSTGNAHTLIAVERLGRILEEARPGDDRAARLDAYGRAVHAELRVIDRLVHGCYRRFARFPAMVSYAMLYFAAATSVEHARRAGVGTDRGFLLAGDARFVDRLAELHDVGRNDDDAAFAARVARAIEPYDRVGLCRAGTMNMHRYA
jgi:FADH2 O2-dependent halogenase